MAQATLVVLRDESRSAAYEQTLRHALERVSPLDVRMPVKVHRREGALLGLLNPTQAILRRDSSVCLGRLATTGPDWHRPGGAIPVGAFALMRTDRHRLELVTDLVASRTLWYHCSEDGFFASTQLRPLVSLLGSFELDHRALPWVLSSGYPGHGLSWDRRVTPVPAGSVLRLDRRSWRVELDTQEIQIGPRPGEARVPSQGHEARLRDVLEERLRFYHRGPEPERDLRRWRMTLSGGFDSRVVLRHLRSAGLVESLTWGVTGSQEEPGTDAWVARRLATSLGTEHTFWALEPPAGEGDRVLDRFVVQAEGRVDHAAGYTDGFRLWRRLHEQGVLGIVRGDEAFGLIRPRFAAPSDVRPGVGGGMIRDFRNLRPHAEAIEEACGPQTWPGELEQRPEETLEQWRDRLHQQYRMPLVMGGLNALKATYVEICNPLLDPEIVRLARALPDSLREEKRLFQRVARSVVPEVPIATARGGVVDLLSLPEVVTLLQDTLGSHRVRDLLPVSLVDAVLRDWRGRDAHPARGAAKNRIKRGLRRFLPSVVTTLLRRGVRPPALGSGPLLMRLYTIARMMETLEEDARDGRSFLDSRG